MKVSKILLIAPPAFTFKACSDINPLPPMGLGYLAAVVSNMGIEVKILDCLIQGWGQEEEENEELIRVGLSEKAIADYIADFNPDIVGVNCQFSRQYKNYHRIFSVIKKVKPECFVIAGGAHVSVCPQEVFKDENCDFILIGEAEESFRHLLECLIKEEEFNAVDGLGFKYNGKMYINEKTKWIDNLDSLPYPAYEIMDLDKYFGLEASHGLRHRNRFSPVITSRGCPAKCTFCSAHKVWGSNYRFRSIDNVLCEMRILKDKYGIEELMFEDDNVTANPKWAKELFSRMIKEEFNFVWDTPNGVGVWSMDEEMIDLMKQSGCTKLNFPVESGSQKVLDTIIKKPIRLSRIKQLIKHCRKSNLNCGMFLVIGMPGETIEDIWASFRFAAKCGCYEPHISVATPYPGTKLFQECMQKGFFAREFTLDDLFIKSFIIKTPNWSEHELRQTLSRGLLYLKIKSLVDNPKGTMLRLIRALKHPGIIMRLLKSIIDALIPKKGVCTIKGV